MKNNSIQPAAHVRISDIFSPPVQCTISSDSNIAKFEEMAKQDSKSLPIVKLAQADDKLYAINHHDVILGCKRAGPDTITKIRAIITDSFAGSTDILIEHVRESITSEPFDPVSLYDIIDYLEERKHLDKKQILKLLWLNDTPYERLILSSNNHISQAAVESLQRLTNNLSARRNLSVYHMQIPLYVLSKISKIKEEKDQLRLISEIEINLSCTSDAMFAWPTPEQIDTIYKYNKQESLREENQREESIIATHTTPKDIARENTDQNLETEIDKETKLVKKSTSNMIIIPNENTGNPTLLVNKKTGAVAKIENNHDDIIKTVSVNSKMLCFMPTDVSSHLGLDGEKTKDNSCVVKHKNFNSAYDLEKFLKFQDMTNAKLALFWSAV